MYTQHKPNLTKFIYGFALVVIFYFIVSIFTGCTSKPTPTDGSSVAKGGQIQPGPFIPVPPPTTGPVIPKKQYGSLSWENTDKPHVERAPWSQNLQELIADNLSVLSSASDLSGFCPKFQGLTDEGKIKAYGELFVALAYYESGYDPNSSSVDVGSGGDKNTWSIGLYSMSVVDQQNYNCPLGFDYNSLLAPLNNEDLMMCIFVKQTQKYGVIAVPAGKGKPGYFATLGPGNKYNQISGIQTRVKNKAQGCI